MRRRSHMPHVAVTAVVILVGGVLLSRHASPAPTPQVEAAPFHVVQPLASFQEPQVPIWYTDRTEQRLRKDANAVKQNSYLLRHENELLRAKVASLTTQLAEEKTATASALAFARKQSTVSADSESQNVGPPEYPEGNAAHAALVDQLWYYTKLAFVITSLVIGVLLYPHFRRTPRMRLQTQS